MKHIDAETLAAFAEGRLSRKEMAPVLMHLRECMACTGDVESVVESMPSRARIRPAWIATAAAAAVAIVVAALLLRTRDPMQRLIALAPRSSRIVEPRLTGGFAWAPYRGPNRAGETGADAERLRLAGAAGDAVARARGDAASEHVAGLALLLVEKPEDAVARLRSAAQQSPSDARAWSDYAAALDDWAVRTERPSLHPQALAAADHALRIDASLPEALFNRALILERLGLTDQARAAWTRYLEVDAASPWASEAREHLRKLPTSTGEARFREEQPALERAARAGDAGTVEALVRRYPQQCRTYGEAQYLGEWGEKKDENALAVARAIGIALAKQSNETLLAEAVQAIDSATVQGRARLAEAHTIYRRGRIAYSKLQAAAAEPDFRRSAALFEQAGSSMSEVARYYAASARYDRDDLAGARAELVALRNASNPRHLALAAQVGWELALTEIVDADWSSALQTLNDAEAKFRTLGERGNHGFILGLQATALSCLGRPDDAWRARIEAFRTLSGEGRGDRLPVTIGGAVRAELHAGRFDSARALLQIEVEANRAAKAANLLANALVRQALVDAESGDFAAAASAAREASAAAEETKDAGMRDLLRAGANVAAGAAALHDDPRSAHAALTRAVDVYRRSERMLFLPQALLLRARASLRLRDTAAAASDVDEGLAATERHRSRLAGPVVATDVLDAATALTREALIMRLDAGDAAGAFACVERRNQRISGDDAAPITAVELQQRLRGSGTAVILLATLPSDVVVIGVSESELLARRVHGGAVYETLIRPAQPLIERASRLVIVPDPALQHVSFAALFDASTKRYLVERLPVAVARSATLLRAERKSTPAHSLLAVGLPAGPLAALPDARGELSELRALYRSGAILESASATLPALAEAARTADVVHIAGHTARQKGAEDLALLFAAENGPRSVSWRDIASMRFTRDCVVVVAACETLRRPDPRSTRALSLAESFLAAGAADVIGTLTPIADRDARDFFRTVHDRVASGVPAGDALRLAQIDAIAREAAGQSTPWRSVAWITTHI